jgi:hypothetical protein
MHCPVQTFCFGFRASDPDSTSTVGKEQLRLKVRLYQISNVPLFKTNMAHYLQENGTLRLRPFTAAKLKKV